MHRYNFIIHQFLKDANYLFSIFIKIPNEAISAMSAVPPKLTKGKGTPVNGKMPIMAPILTIACTPIQRATPMAKNLTKLSWLARAKCNILKIRMNKKITKTAVRKNPSSSAMAAKIESPITSGRYPKICREPPKPRPNKPPEPTAINAWLI